MEGQEHYMAFEKRNRKNEVQVKSRLVPLPRRANKD
jgi:hypothetical protein